MRTEYGTKIEDRSEGNPTNARDILRRDVCTYAFIQTVMAGYYNFFIFRKKSLKTWAQTHRRLLAFELMKNFCYVYMIEVTELIGEGYGNSAASKIT